MPREYFGCWNRTFGDLSNTETASEQTRETFINDVDLETAQKAYDALPDVDQLKVMESAKAFLLAALDEYERNVVEPTRKRLKSLGSSKKHR